MDMERARRAQAALDSANEARDEERAAESRLIRACMNEKGFTVFPSGGANGGGGVGGEAGGAGFGEDLSPSPEAARAAGYGVDPRRSGARKDGKAAEDTDGDDFDALPQDVKRAHGMAMDGYVDRPEGGVEFDFGGGKVMVPSKGCRGETLKALYGDVKEYLRLNWTVYNTVKQNGARILADDDAYQDALSQWASCMKDGGYPEVPTPEKARQVARARYADLPDSDPAAFDKALRAEVEQAVTDAECGTRSGLNATAREARSRASARSLVKHEADIMAWLELVTKARDRARALLGDTS
ncbi:hypothetical protein AB0N09_31060 [Streptomyces erythrochromogenes]|uniref:hypothetical protein n=1 Tax=Streptomyces erythrochromogenes TaxID=285574 RepID=UPI003431987B